MLCSCCRKPDLLVRMRAVLSEEDRGSRIGKGEREMREEEGEEPRSGLVSWVEESEGKE